MHVLSLCGQEVGLSKNPSVSSLVLASFLFHRVQSLESEELCFPVADQICIVLESLLSLSFVLAQAVFLSIWTRN